METVPDRSLAIADVDIESLILARNDVHPDGDWWFDTHRGTSLYYGVDDDTDLPALVDGVHVLIPSEPQPRSDVDDFFSAAGDLGVEAGVIADLYAAYRGKGGLRRFRERVATGPAGAAWTTFTIERESDRAIQWLHARGLVDPAVDTVRS